MTRHRLASVEEVIQVLDAVIAAGSIYKVDLDPIKYDLDRLYDADRSAVNDKHAMVCRAGGETSETDNDLYWKVPFSVMHVTSKSFMKTLDAAGETEFAGAVREFAVRWTPVAEKLKQVKPLIVKGRKPSTEPRKTPERTLDNTGTCGVCGQNVKRDARGKIVHHGFEVRWNSRMGACVGCGCDPIEVSPEALHRYVDFLKNARESHEQELANLRTNPYMTMYTWTGIEVKYGDRAHAGLYDAKIHEIEANIRYIGKDLERTEQRIAEWAPQPLPDQKVA